MSHLTKAVFLTVLLTAVLSRKLVWSGSEQDYDELRETLIKTRDKLTDLEDRFEDCKEELEDYQSLHGKRDTDYEHLLEHFTQCIRSLEEYMRKETEVEEEFEKIKADSKASKELFVEREKELSEKIKTLEADGTICEVDETVVEEKYDEEISKLRKSKEKAEENSADLFNTLQELLQAHSKVNQQLQDEQDKAFDLSQENEDLKKRLNDLEWKYKAQDKLASNVRDCTTELEKTKHEMEKKEEHMEKCAKSNNNCMKSRSNLQSDKKRWENQQEEYEKQVNELKKELDEAKAKAAAQPPRAETSGITIEKGQEQVVKMIADELLACKMKTDTLQTDNRKLEEDFEMMREQLENVKAESIDGTNEDVKKLRDEFSACRTELEKIEAERAGFEKKYNDKIKEMREKLGNELVTWKTKVQALTTEKENLEMDKESLYDQMKSCDSRIAQMADEKDKLLMDKDSLYSQIKKCRENKSLNEDDEKMMKQLQQKAAAAEAERQNCETRMKTKEEEDIAVVKALMEKKAKETQATISEITQSNKETQMKLNSCEFNLQIKEHELDSAQAMSKSANEKLEECEKKTKEANNDEKTSEADSKPEEKKKPVPTFFQAKSPVEACENKLNEVLVDFQDLKESNEEAEVELEECRKAISECGPEREQLKMMNSGLRMVLDQTEPKYKAEIAELKESVRECSLELAVTHNDADKYMKSFGVCMAILMIIVVTSSVKYGMRWYEERVENARLQKKREKEERRNKKSGRKH